MAKLWQVLVCVFLSINAAPPRTIPVEHYDAYTMQGRAAITYHYFDGTVSTPKHHTKEILQSYMDQIRRGQTFYYGPTDTWLYQALRRFPVQGKQVAIFGSTKPIYEAVCLCFGGTPITIEYNKWTTDSPDLSCMTPDEYDQDPILFDAAFSISSFEHDGLGRYGDPINPVGDLETMKKVKTMLKPGGLLFLSVPVGRDRVFWNAHRIYGKHRLPLLLEGWEPVGFFGMSGLTDPKINQGNMDAYYQPIIVLKNK